MGNIDIYDLEDADVLPDGIALWGVSTERNRRLYPSSYFGERASVTSVGTSHYSVSIYTNDMDNIIDQVNTKFNEKHTPHNLMRIVFFFTD